MDSTATQRPAEVATFSKAYQRWLLFVLMLVCTINYADRSVVASVAEPLRRDFGINDFQLGLLQGLSFALLYSILGIPFARLAERRNRVRIVAAATFVWSFMTVFCGAAANYLQMLIMRVGVGVGEAGFMSPASSLLGDHFPRQRRAFATSIMMLGVPVGALIGAASGGFIAQSLGWRWAFVIMGVPGIFIALLVWLTLREPPRGHIEGETQHDVPSMRTVARQCMSNAVFRHVVIGGVLGGFGLHGVGQFLGVYFIRAYDLQFGLAGMLYGLVAFVNVGSGLLISGLVTDRLGRTNLKWNSWVPAIGMLLSAPLYLLAFTAQSLPVTIALLCAGGASLVLHYGPSLATIQNLATSRTRASTIALYQLIVSAVSMGLGTPLIGFISDVYAARMAPELGTQASALGLRYALMTSTLLFIWGSVHYLFAARLQSRS
jgi:predicted MFS family arabinose efflux permease